MITLTQPEPDPIDAALTEWLPEADLYRDGQLMHAKVDLLGSNKVAGARWVKAIHAHLTGETPADRVGALTEFLLTAEASEHVRAYSAAPMIAESIVRMLTDQGLL